MSHSHEVPRNESAQPDAPRTFFLQGLGEELLKAADRQVEQQRAASEQPATPENVNIPKTK